MNMTSTVNSTGDRPWGDGMRNRLRRAIKHYGTQQELSDASGVPLPTIQKVLNSKSEPKIGTLFALLGELGLTYRALGEISLTEPASSVRKVRVFGLDQADQPDRTAFTNITACKCPDIDPRQIDWLFKRIDSLEHRLAAEGRARKQLEAYVEQRFARQHHQNGLMADLFAGLTEWQDASNRWLTRIENTLAALPLIGKRFVKGRTGGAA